MIIWLVAIKIKNIFFAFSSVVPANLFEQTWEPFLKAKQLQCLKVTIRNKIYNISVFLSLVEPMGNKPHTVHFHK